ncbi:hypothetical protein ADEAN_000111900 [Angomonas deanei]|uniref:Uncharacterized protein n=1 Tax=Angomonas deanei TaxID=59799 RepID=A0A7G2C211_9TRYP|nr:hypothetical protein ADEAN_000111900 [Angomonas deanei]
MNVEQHKIDYTKNSPIRSSYQTCDSKSLECSPFQCVSLLSLLLKLSLVVDPATEKVNCRLRHALLIGPVATSLHLVQKLKKNPSKCRTITSRKNMYSMSEQEEENVKVKTCIKMGYDLIIVEAFHIFHYINDVLNQHYNERYWEDKKKHTYQSVLNNKGATEYVYVHPDFRIIAVVSEEGYSRMEGPIRGRFAKFSLTYNEFLEKSRVEQIDSIIKQYGVTLKDLGFSDSEEEETGNLLYYLIPGFSHDMVYNIFLSRKTEDNVEATRKVVQRELCRLVSPRRLVGIRRWVNRDHDHRSRITGVAKAMETFFPAALDRKDDLSGAFPGGTRKHALVFTSQRQEYTQCDSILHLFLAQWCQVCKITLSRDNYDKHVFQLASMSVSDIQKAVKRADRTTGDVPIVFYLDTSAMERTVFTGPTRHREEIADTVASQLRRCYAALEEAGLSSNARVRVAIIVSVEEDAFFDDEGGMERDKRVAQWRSAFFVDPATEWVQENETWFCATLDEVYPCERASKEVLHVNCKPEFNLCKTYQAEESCSVHRAALSILAGEDNVEFVRNVLSDFRVQLAQDLTQDMESKKERTDWAKGIDELLNKSRASMRDLLLNHILTLCQGIGKVNSPSYHQEQGEKKKNLRYYAYTRSVSLRSELYHTVVRIILNVARQVFATLFSRGDEIAQISNVVSTDNLIYQFTERILNEFFPSDRDASILVGPARLSVKDLRTRQSLLSRGAQSEKSVLVPAHLPFSFMIYQLLHLEKHKGGHSISELLSKSREKDYARRYVHDAITFLLESHFDIKEEDTSYNTGVQLLMTCLVVLLHRGSDGDEEKYNSVAPGEGRDGGRPPFCREAALHASLLPVGVKCCTLQWGVPSRFRGRRNTTYRTA